jgi:hypothetical protein
MLVAPITTQVDTHTQLANRSFWVPPGIWCDVVNGGATFKASATGTLITELRQTLWEVPVFVKAGTMLPLAAPATSDTAMGNAIRSTGGAGGAGGADGASASNPGSTEVHWEIYHGWQQQGSGSVYEDGLWTNASFKLGPVSPEQGHATATYGTPRAVAPVSMTISLSLPAGPAPTPPLSPTTTTTSSVLVAAPSSSPVVQQFDLMLSNQAATIEVGVV